MGYDLPAAIGAAVARGGKRVICLAGDGSVQMNLQELQTVVHHQLPIKIFILDNRGYLSIRQSQQSFFKRLIGEGPDNGVSFPIWRRYAGVWSPRGTHRAGNLSAAIDYVLGTEGPIVAEAVLDPNQGFEQTVRPSNCLTVP